MTPADRDHLARLLSLRDLLAILFEEPAAVPGESPATLVLADLLEAQGYHDVADAVRGRYLSPGGADYQLHSERSTSMRTEDGQVIRAVEFLVIPRPKESAFKKVR